MASMWSPIFGLLLVFLPLAPSSSSHVRFRLHGNVYPLGHFYVTMSIGVPPKPYYLDVDTGSNLTWLECDHPCLRCNRVPFPLYKPTQSNLKVPCGHQCCNALREDVPGLDALNLILIGDVTMQDLFVIYDNESGRLGWDRATCNRLRESESVISPRL